jgi:AdoMet-dependent heme synthase
MWEIKETVQGWAADYAMDMVPSFHFTGGEPFLRDDLFDILAESVKLNFTTALMTNGTLITADKASRLKNIGISDIQISIEGTEEVHDSIRGNGSYLKAVRGMTNCVAAGIDTHINLTISRLNKNQIVEMVKLAEDLGISAVTFSRLVACGRGMEMTDQMLSSMELSDLYFGLHASSESNKVVILSGDPLFHIPELSADINTMEFPAGGCAAGVFGITITADGGIMPCRRMDLTIGNIKSDSIKDLWANSRVLWSLRSRESYTGNCGRCRYWAWCRGCRAIALADSRNRGIEDYLGDDPQCSYFKPVN